MKKKHAGGKSKTYDPMEDPNFDHDKAERTRGSMEEETNLSEEGKKDACYHKVKSRYSVYFCLRYFFLCRCSSLQERS